MDAKTEGETVTEKSTFYMRRWDGDELDFYGRVNKDGQAANCLTAANMRSFARRFPNIATLMRKDREAVYEAEITFCVTRKIRGEK
jgi:hypothetical protein